MRRLEAGQFEVRISKNFNVTASMNSIFNKQHPVQFMEYIEILGPSRESWGKMLPETAPKYIFYSITTTAKYIYVAICSLQLGLTGMLQHLIFLMRLQRGFKGLQFPADFMWEDCLQKGLLFQSRSLLEISLARSRYLRDWRNDSL